ncbi:DsbA family protein [Roseovarius aestuariivivens]|uniref:DsbA family protein n=1 Tax=Roseovarius aestuariivivens TaxID=1888910 RepID=UPI001080E3F5|nr:DsbA family protein [Roseovarius aestuariivivens]
MKNVLLSGAIALALAAGAGYWLSQSASPTAPAGTDLFGAANAQDASEVDTSTITEMTMGSEDASVTVIEYASFTCPHCANFHANQLKQLKADYIDTGKIRFIYRDVYFDRFGLWASMVARCGGEQRFFGIADMIYDQQKDWIGNGQDPVAITDRLRKIGKVAGLSEDQLEACLTDAQKAKTLVAWFQENAEADGVQSTPTLVINGETYSNMPYAELKGILDGLIDE